LTRQRHTPHLLVGAALCLALSLLPPHAPLCSAPSAPRIGPEREVYLASLYRRSSRFGTDFASETLRRDRPGYWNGVPDQVLLKRIQKQPIKRISFNRGGSSLSLRLRLADGSSAAFKPEQIHTQTVPRKEIAAYRLNRLLGLSRVPPATWRVLTWRDLYARIDPDEKRYFFRFKKEARFRKGGRLVGEVSWWIPKIRYIPIDRWKARKRWHQWLKAYKHLPGRYVEVTAQLSVMLLYDFLINNPDRFSGFNTMGTPDTKFLYFMDNTYSFFPTPRGGTNARTGLERVQRFSRKLFRNLKRLTYARLRAAMALDAGAPMTLLSDHELRMVIARRNHAIQHINWVIARYGWEKTMVFP
jgi:hypothetical protein